MSPKESVIRLLTIEDRQEDAERVISALRNAGVAVRPVQAKNEAELIEALKKDAFDVAVIGAENKAVALGQASKLIRNSGRDVPIVAVLSELTETAILQAFSAGSPHLAPRDEPEMLHFVITAAYTALQRKGIPSQFLYFPDENHWVLKPQNSVQWHNAVDAWLDRWTAEQ